MDDESRHNLHENAPADPEDSPKATANAALAKSVEMDQQRETETKANDPADGKNKTEQEILDRVKTGERWMIFLTAIVAGSAIFQTVQSCNNNASTAKQVDRIICAADRIGGAADSFSGSASRINDGVVGAVGKLQKQVEETERSRKSAGRSSRIDERAWVSFQLKNLIFEEGKPLAITTQFSNSGKTPAVYAKTCQAVKIVGRDPKRVDIGCPDDKRGHGFSIIEPQGNIQRLSNASGAEVGSNSSPDGLLHAPLIDDLRSGKKFLYLYGRTDYKDIFGRSHWTTFCSILLIMPPTPGGLPETHSWILCENGNDTDKNY
jgi:hypothetical protein